jgi:hypothetical protein
MMSDKFFILQNRCSDIIENLPSVHDTDKVYTETELEGQLNQVATLRTSAVALYAEEANQLTGEHIAQYTDFLLQLDSAMLDCLQWKAKHIQPDDVPPVDSPQFSGVALVTGDPDALDEVELTWSVNGREVSIMQDDTSPTGWMLIETINTKVEWLGPVDFQAGNYAIVYKPH